CRGSAPSRFRGPRVHLRERNRSSRLAPVDRGRSSMSRETKKAEHEVGLEELARRRCRFGACREARHLRTGHSRHQASWAFTFSTMLPKAAGSLTAMSARTLRSMSIDAFFKPAMN